ncbi:hypothetical protein ACRZ5S_04730 [Vibrio scophthalmi]|uniref:hypothetical protein n=1 Tax=Vibrio scophthalmi TaxID=45658 RepID=UPI003EBF1D33
MKKALNIILNGVIVVFFAILTQVGALTYLLSTLVSKLFKIKSFSYKVLLNIALYALFTFALVPIIAPIFGRVAITNTAVLKPWNYWVTVGLNRNYVVPELEQVLQKLSKDMMPQSPSVILYYLDAGFPFFDKYPLLPHLSHHDGKKVDLSYLYQDEKGNFTNLKPSISGYGVFESSNENEYNTAKFCKDNGYFQYDYPKFLTLGRTDSKLTFSNLWNKKLMHSILANDAVIKVFIEPHLVKRLGLIDNRIRFHGCGAVRHDDHIHIQI